jgi:hypothetical protein
VKVRRALAVAALVLLLVSCTSFDPLPGYRPATDDERAGAMRTVVEYYDIWNRAMVTGDIGQLYVRHPKLSQGAVKERGINSERFTVELPSVRDHLIRDSSVQIEWYEPLRAFVKGDRAVVYSHGLFTWNYANGSPTKGELFVRFDMTRTANAWSIDQTDEWVLGEGTPPPTPR